MSFLSSLLSSSPSHHGLDARLSRIERKLDAICDHLGLGGEAPVRVSERVTGALLRGKKIEAIKIYREEHGVGLREAKEAVDAAERQL